MSSKRTFKIVLNRNDVKIYMDSLEKRSKEIAKSKRNQIKNNDELKCETAGMQTRSRTKRGFKDDTKENSCVVKQHNTKTAPAVQNKGRKTTNSLPMIDNLNKSQIMNEVVLIKRKRNERENDEESNTETTKIEIRSRALKKRKLEDDAKESSSLIKQNNTKTILAVQNKGCKTKSQSMIERSNSQITKKVVSPTHESNERVNEDSKSKTPKMQTRSPTLKENLLKDTNKISPSKEPSLQVVVQPNEKSIRTKRRVVKMPKIASNTLMPILHQHELVWAYIKGYPSWPGVIEEFLANGKILIHFFGDYSRGEVTRRCIMNYFEGFNRFSCNFGNIKLRKAVEEAKYFLFGHQNPNECYVCKVLDFKRQYLHEKKFLNTNE